MLLQISIAGAPDEASNTRMPLRWREGQVKRLKKYDALVRYLRDLHEILAKTEPDSFETWALERDIVWDSFAQSEPENSK